MSVDRLKLIEVFRKQIQDNPNDYETVRKGVNGINTVLKEVQGKNQDYIELNAAFSDYIKTKEVSKIIRITNNIISKLV